MGHYAPSDREVVCLEFTPRLLAEFRSIVERSTTYKVTGGGAHSGKRTGDPIFIVRQCLRRCVPASRVDATQSDIPKSGYKKPVTFALISLGFSASRTEVYSHGYSDYIAYPFVIGEIQHRFAAGHAIVRSTRPEPVFAKDPLVDTTCTFLTKRLGFSKGIDALAHEVGSNRNTLTRRFNNEFGVGPMAWFRRHRLTLAAGLIVESRRSIQDIAFAIGYEDANNFSTAFKRAFNTSPKDYRRIKQGSVKGPSKHSSAVEI
ncbi:AraC family transcriptional regulator [Ruegeria sp. HKCCD8929]|uniref:helix-turn-helix domain-containing protein n=1 Tax=Ruegeria sp. HKCCD8929 TaxID=2683006 RepID=UPI0014882485|nr:AraC family transcriptional regulator [Ruegeria sp. HKCCD8929]